MTERTLVLVKPDAVQRLLVGRIVSRFEERGLKLIGMKLLQVDRQLAEAHYAIHRGKPFFEGLVAFITSSPLVASQAGFSALDRDMIAFAYQFGSLILPAVVPAVAWVLTHRAFLERLRASYDRRQRG